MTRSAAIDSLLATAHALRGELAENRASIRRRLRTCGRHDPMQTITGASALDRACDELDMLIADLAEHECACQPRVHPIVDITPLAARQSRTICVA